LNKEYGKPRKLGEHLKGHKVAHSKISYEGSRKQLIKKLKEIE